MEGANDGILAIRMKSDVVTWPRVEGGGWRESKYCVEPGTYCGLILLLSTRNGEPLGFLNDGVLQHMISTACGPPSRPPGSSRACT